MMLTEWIFTNKCKAYIDANGFALEGAALEAAKRDKHARRCNHRVVIGSKCCPSCGAPAPGGWWTCAKCGKVIGNDSDVCSHCGSEQNLALRPQLKAGVWHPEEGIVAQRFELNAYKNVMPKGLDIQTGQLGCLLVGGDVRRILPPGNYPLDVLMNELGDSKESVSGSVIFIQDGELTFPIKLADMRTKEGLDAEVEFDVVIALDPNRVSSFVKNVMSNDRLVSGRPLNATFSKDSLVCNVLLGEIDVTVRQFCFEHEADELFLKPELTLELESRLAQRLESALQATGFLFRRLGEVAFAGRVFEELRKMAGDIEGIRREQEYRLRADLLMKNQEKQLNQHDMEHEQYLKQLAQEMKISDLVRDQELARLHESDNLERGLADLDRRYQLAKKELNDTEELNKLQDKYDAERKKLVKDSEIERRQAEHDELLRQRRAEMNCAFDNSKLKLEIKRMTDETEHSRVMNWLEEQAKAKGIRDTSDFAFMEYLKLCDPQTQLSMLMVRGITPAQAEMIIENNEKFLLAKMTSEQIVAWGIAHGKAGAEALKALRAENRDALYERIIADVRSDYKAMLERDERMFGKGVDATASAAHASGAAAPSITTQVLK